MPLKHLALKRCMLTVTAERHAYTSQGFTQQDPAYLAQSHKPFFIIGPRQGTMSSFLSNTISFNYDRLCFRLDYNCLHAMMTQLQTATLAANCMPLNDTAVTGDATLP